MNGRDKIALTLLTLLLSGIVAYYGGQITIAQQMGDRPTRQEMKETVKAVQEQTQQQLEDIKKQQDRTYNEIQEINRNLRELIRRDNRRNER